MPKQRKNLGNYELKIQNYLKTKKRLLTPQGLNNVLEVDRKFIYDCRRRNDPWRKKFINSYDKARAIISEAMLNEALVKPELIYAHWVKCYPREHEYFDSDEQNNSNQIIINIDTPRMVTNDE